MITDQRKLLATETNAPVASCSPQNDLDYATVV